MYCFEDAHDPSTQSTGASVRVGLHVHTPFRWGDRKRKNPEARTEFVTSANVRHLWQQGKSFQHETSKWYLVPVDEVLKKEWRTLPEDQIKWQWKKPGSIPPAEGPQTRARGRYDAVRRVIKHGEALREEHRVVSNDWKQTEKAVRGLAGQAYEDGEGQEEYGTGDEYEVVAVAPPRSPRASLPRASTPRASGGGPSMEQRVAERDCSALDEPDPVTARPYSILFVGANSQAGAFLNIDEECREARTALTLSRGTVAWEDLVKFQADRYATAATLMSTIQNVHPTVLQFSCHGELHVLWLSDGRVEREKLVSSLADYNRSPQTRERIRLLILTVCLSGTLADELGEIIDFVIGHGKEEVQDDHAIEFTRTLFNSLGQGRSLAESFKAANLASAAFHLVARGANPERFFLPIPEKDVALQEKVKELEEKLKERDRHQDELQKALSASTQGMQHFFEYAPFSVEEWTTVHNGESDDDEEERSLLGEGAFGKTSRMKARVKIEGAGVEPGQLFAMKTISSKTMKKKGISEQNIKHEVGVLQRLRHRNIIRCFHLFCEKKNFHLVMEIALGGHLADKIKAGPEDPAHVQRWMLQLASAFTYMHQQGVYHQDVKPENILLSERGSVKVSSIDRARTCELAS